jgi:hypothetical protein
MAQVYSHTYSLRNSARHLPLAWLRSATSPLPASTRSKPGAVSQGLTEVDRVGSAEVDAQPFDRALDFDDLVAFRRRTRGCDRHCPQSDRGERDAQHLHPRLPTVVIVRQKKMWK